MESKNIATYSFRAEGKGAQRGQAGIPKQHSKLLVSRAGAGTQAPVSRPRLVHSPAPAQPPESQQSPPHTLPSWGRELGQAPGRYRLDLSVIYSPRLSFTAQSSRRCSGQLKAKPSSLLSCQDHRFGSYCLLLVAPCHPGQSLQLLRGHTPKVLLKALFPIHLLQNPSLESPPKRSQCFYPSFVPFKQEGPPDPPGYEDSPALPSQGRCL